MTKYIYFFLGLFLTINVQGQIIIDNSTLPEIDDQLEYSFFTFNDAENSFKLNGENLYWEFKNINPTGTVTDSYLDISNTELADSFPAANMIVNLSGFETAAIRNENQIEIIGLSISSFSLFEVEGITKFEEPFTHRKTPYTYGEKIEDEFSFLVQFPSDVIPGLDTITLPIPGATLDSVRVLTTFFKTEEATGWGKLNVLGNEFEVLKVEQFDSTATKIEIALGAFGSVLWIDATTLAGDMFGNLNRGSITHKFLANDSKQSIAEFREMQEQDSTGVVFNTVTGRIRADIMSSNTNIDVHQSIVVSPNPSADFITISSNDNSLNTDKIELQIWSLDGKLCKQLNSQKFNQPISVAELPKGMYTIHILPDGKTLYQKSFIKI